MCIRDSIKTTTLDTLIQYQIVTDLDQEYNLQDEKEVQSYLDEMIANNIENFGSEEEFEKSLANSGVTKETILYLYKTQYLSLIHIYKIFISALMLALVSVIAAMLGLVSGTNAIGVSAIFGALRCV